MIPHLYYFTKGEFVRGEDWSLMMSHRLLICLDILRHRWGKTISISAADGAIGRRMGGQDLSQHNVDVWGEVRAVDVMPAGIVTDADAYAFYVLAVECGFTGIGFYPSWQPNPGFHLDVRQDRHPGSPATWGGVLGDEGKQVWVSLNQALEALA
jgi:hypothetical protein